MKNFKYIGSELELFKFAKNWKRYWKNSLAKYVGGVVYDVGAGIGSTAELFSRHNVSEWICIEPDLTNYDLIVKKINSNQLPSSTKAFCGTLSDLQSANRPDCILYIDVLEHIENDAQELMIAAELIPKDGRIIILSPAHNFLYTAFDESVGHYRRYSKETLKSIFPESLTLVEFKYLDSVGLLASLYNRYIMKSAVPKFSQIKFWDSFMVPLSKIIDPLFGYRLGKSVLLILEKN